MNEDEEEDEDSKLEIDESDPEDNNNIQVDGGDEGLMVSEDTQQQSECEFYFLPDEIVEVSTGLRKGPYYCPLCVKSSLGNLSAKLTGG